MGTLHRIHKNERAPGISVEQAGASSELQVVAKADIVEQPTEQQLAAREEIRRWLEYLAIRGPRRGGTLNALLLAAGPTTFVAATVVGKMSLEECVVAACGVGFLALVAWTVRQFQNIHLAANDALAPRAGCEAWIGPLGEALRSPMRRVRFAAKGILLNILPWVTPADFATMTRSERDHLYSYLRTFPTGNSELSGAIIQTIGRCAGPDSITTLQLIADGMVWRLLDISQLAAAAITAIQARESPQAPLVEAQAAAAAPLVADDAAISAPPTGGAVREIMARIAALEDQLRAAREAEAIADAPNYVDPLIDRVEAACKRNDHPSLRTGIMYAGWAVALPFALWRLIDAGHAGERGALIGYSALLVAALILPKWVLPQSLLSAARDLAKCNDKRAVGKLTEMLEWPDRRLKEAASGALVRLLPRLMASDRALLTDSQRQILCTRLQMTNIGADQKLVIAILRSFEQVGDHNCLPAVSRLALTAPSSPAQRTIVERAQRCREFLSEHADQSRFSQTLLRASDANAAGSDTLVRPVLTTPDAAPEQLLRAGADPYRRIVDP